MAKTLSLSSLKRMSWSVPGWMKGIPDEAITDDVLRQVRKMVDSGLECWSEVVTTSIDFALKS